LQIDGKPIKHLYNFNTPSKNGKQGLYTGYLQPDELSQLEF